MSIETTVMLFAIVLPFAIFAGVLGWAQSRTNEFEPELHSTRCRMREPPTELASQGPPACPSCGKPMAFARTVPRFGRHPELRSFWCAPCQEVSTISIGDGT